MSNELPPRLSEPFLDIHNEVIWLHTKWKLFCDLYYKSKKRIKLLNHSAEFFFGTLQGVLIDDVILGLARLVDRTRNTLTLEVLIKSIELGKHPKLEAKLREALISIQSEMANFLEIRDNRIAHLNREVATRGANSGVLPGISYDDIERVLLEIRNFLNAISLYFSEEETLYEHVLSTSDADTLLYTLRKAAGYDLAVRQGKLGRRFWEESDFSDD